MVVLLYLVATPIGHLDDLSKRALETLACADTILCEDTRRTSILLERYQIRKPLRSYHQFKERQALESILEQLAKGEHVCLVSDAGTPCINDPGHVLVAACIENNIPFTAIPGPCSIIQALVLSGMDTQRFQFLGFLPSNSEAALKPALYYPGTTIAFESPERLCETLRTLQALDPKRPIAVVREMTKIYEECRRALPGELLAHFSANPPRGEIVLCIAKGKPAEEHLSIEETVDLLQQLHGLSLKEAIQTTARLKEVPKRTVYQTIHHKKGN